MVEYPIVIHFAKDGTVTFNLSEKFIQDIEAYKADQKQENIAVCVKPGTVLEIVEIASNE